MRFVEKTKSGFEKDYKMRSRELVKLYAQPKDTKPEFWEQFKIGKSC